MGYSANCAQSNYLLLSISIFTLRDKTCFVKHLNEYLLWVSDIRKESHPKRTALIYGYLLILRVPETRNRCRCSHSRWQAA